MAAEPKEKQKATEAGGGAGTAEGDAGFTAEEIQAADEQLVRAPVSFLSFVQRTVCVALLKATDSSGRQSAPRCPCR